MDSTPAISVVATAPRPTQSTARRPSAGAIWGGLGTEPCGTCSPEDIGYTRSLGDGSGPVGGQYQPFTAVSGIVAASLDPPGRERHRPGRESKRAYPAISALSGKALASWMRDLTPSFWKTFFRWYSTVCGLMKS